MNNIDACITGIGVVAPNGTGKEAFWQALEEGRDAVGKITGFAADPFPGALAGEIRDLDPKVHLGPKGLRNLDRATIFLLIASKFALDDARLAIDEKTCDTTGVCTGTSFSHVLPIVDFDKDVLTEGLNFSNPALFPSTVINAVSSQVSIRNNIQGFNTTVSTGYTSGLEAVRYALNALETGQAEAVLAGSVESLSFPVYYALHKLEYMAGLKGIPLSCPFDSRRNGPVPGEAAAVFCVESTEDARRRGVRIYARVRSIASYFDASNMGKVSPRGEGLERAVRDALNAADIAPDRIDYISSCANSSQELDKVETLVLKKVFGEALKAIPVSSVKSMVGETFSASSALQIASCIGAMEHGIIPPTINCADQDPACDIDCVPNTARKKQVTTALITSSGPGGYNSACILEKYHE